MAFRVLVFAVLLLQAAVPAFAAAAFNLHDSGTEDVIDYEKYGEFIATGTTEYRYRIINSSGLKAAAGEGIFPNSSSVYQDPQYKKLKREGKLNGSHWDFVDTDDFEANFYKWTTAQEDPGVKLFNTAVALEKSGNLQHAVKAYYAVIVHFPKSHGFTYWGTPWYIGPVAVDKVKLILREHPEFGLELVGASVRVRNNLDNDVKNDQFAVIPGSLVKVKPGKIASEPAKIDLKTAAVTKTIGDGRVKLQQFVNDHWQLTVDDKPYVVRGIAYSPNKVGLSPDRGTLNVSRDWAFADFNKNGKIDGPYEAWVDKNRNNKMDPDEPPVGDFKLMKDMGVNTLRIYHYADHNKTLLMDGYKRFGFMYLMGNMIGNYCVDSGAQWFEGTDYANEAQQKNMLESVRKMVEEYKDEPYVLMWVLGNENNYSEPGRPGESSGNGCRARLQPKDYYRFVNEAAKLIKSMDPQRRPVAICNGDTLYLDICAAEAPDIDVFGVNCYRGEQGFGSLWNDVSEIYDKPVLITEYGCSAYHPSWNLKRTEAAQAKYLKNNWLDIEANMAGSGAGNALGGILFEWADEWWKANSDLPLKIQQQKKDWYAARSAQYKDLQPGKHDTVPQFGAPFLDGWSYEEWFGVATQGNGSDSPFLRQLRPAYFTYQQLWKKYRDADKKK